MTTTKNHQHPSGPTVVTATEIVMPGIIEPAGLQIRIPAAGRSRGRSGPGFR